MRLMVPRPFRKIVSADVICGLHTQTTFQDTCLYNTRNCLCTCTTKSGTIIAELTFTASVSKKW